MSVCVSQSLFRRWSPRWTAPKSYVSMSSRILGTFPAVFRPSHKPSLNMLKVSVCLNYPKHGEHKYTLLLSQSPLKSMPGLRGTVKYIKLNWTILQCTSPYIVYKNYNLCCSSVGISNPTTPNMQLSWNCKHADIYSMYIQTHCYRTADADKNSLHPGLATWHSWERWAAGHERERTNKQS